MAGTPHLKALGWVLEKTRELEMLCRSWKSFSWGWLQGVKERKDSQSRDGVMLLRECQGNNEDYPLGGGRWVDGTSDLALLFARASPVPV